MKPAQPMKVVAGFVVCDIRLTSMKKRLIYRLSSLGDVVISMAALEREYPGETHWVVSRELVGFLEKHPSITKVIPFDRRKSSTFDWIELNRRIFAENHYDEVWDLHRTWRTLLARVLSLFSSGRPGDWKTITKERGKRLGYTILKRLWPEGWRPQGIRRQILGFSDAVKIEGPVMKLQGVGESSRPRIGIAPSSAWRGKEWDAEQFAILAAALSPDFDLVLLGTPEDANAQKFARLAAAAGLPFESWLGKYPLSELPSRLAELSLVISCDSGLAHLSELGGTPVVVIYGPTRADFGFGPKLEGSRSVETPLWCSPCSKDGSLCFRVFHRYKCLDQISPEAVEVVVRQVLDSGKRRVSLGQ